MNCHHCGANLSLDDLTKPNCPYCHHVLKHHAQAAEHAVLVNKILEQRIGAQYPGLAPGQIPQIGHQFGAPMSPSFQQFQQHQMNHAFKRAGWITALAIGIPLLAALLIGGVAVVLMFVLR